MLDLVFAVFLPALGAAIVFDIGASTGGTDIVASDSCKIYLYGDRQSTDGQRYPHCAGGGIRFGMGTGLYCILGLIGKTFVVDGAIENNEVRCKSLSV